MDQELKNQSIYPSLEDNYQMTIQDLKINLELLLEFSKQ